MAKTNGNPNGANGNGAIHFLMQGKGGVGKSFCSWILAEYLRDKGYDVHGIDTDASNQTFTQYKALNVQALKLSDDGMDVEPRRFDQMMERLLTEQGSFVVDTGSNTFLPLWKYMVENGALQMLRDAGRKVYLHSVVTGGQALVDTLNGMDHIAKFADDKSMVVWLNEFFGKVESDSPEGVKAFPTMKAYTKNEAKVLGVVAVTKRSADTFGKDLHEVTKNKQTFKEALEAEGVTLMAKQRLKTTQRDLYEQLERVGL
jgi:hypothetical protein